jgi:hypothetical protein
MPENNNAKNKNVTVAQLQDGEALIPHPLIEQYTKAVEAQEERENVISSDNVATNPNVSVVSNDDNVIGSGSADKKEAVRLNPVEEKETVAVYSTKNVTWSGVGQVSKGYNIVTKQAAEKWATRSHIRIATPEEVARDFGK